jgi:hypothetical protein
MLGLAGCGPDNETEGQKLGTQSGDPGKVNPDAIPKDKVTPPRTNKERESRGPSGTQEQMKKSGGYPTSK